MPASTPGKAISKRSRYVLRACNECKRRKVKCDGREPCERCISQNGACSYDRQGRGGRLGHHGKPRGEVAVQMRRMQNVLDDLVQRLSPPPTQSQSSFEPSHNTLDSSIVMDSVPHEPRWCDTSLQESASPPIRGPTSPRFTFDVVKRRFRERGFDSESTVELTHENESRSNMITATIPGSWKLSPALRSVLKDPLWDINGPEAARLIRLFARGTALMYPAVVTERLIAEADILYATVDCIRAARESNEIHVERLLKYDFIALKLVLAVGVVLEKKASAKFAERLLQSVQEDLWESIWRGSSLTTLRHIMLLAIYHFHLDEETTAGRFTSMGARLCIELGLNRQQNIARSFATTEAREEATICFWCAYALDRRGSIGLGVPYILQDSDIDTAAPQASFDLTFPCHSGLDTTDDIRTREASKQYIIAMIKFTQLSGKACELVNKLGDRQLNIPCQDLEYLDYQVLQWHRSIPDGLKLHRSELTTKESTPKDSADASILFLRVVLNARMNQLRNLIFRPILYHSTRISQYPDQARTAVEVARESVLLLWTLNESTEALRSHPVFFKHFLVSAFGLILLAVVNAWSELGQRIAHEFYLALDLFKIMSAESPLVTRYSTTINGLEELAHKIGLPRTRAPQPHTAREATGYAQDNITDTTGLDYDHTLARYPSFDPSNLPSSATNDTVDVRDEFANFLDLDAGQLSSFFDFPLGDMFSAEVLDI